MGEKFIQIKRFSRLEEYSRHLFFGHYALRAMGLVEHAVAHFVSYQRLFVPIVHKRPKMPIDHDMPFANKWCYAPPVFFAAQFAERNRNIRRDGGQILTTTFARINKILSKWAKLILAEMGRKLIWQSPAGRHQQNYCKSYVSSFHSFSLSANCVGIMGAV